MKKFLIALLFIIPVVVILALYTTAEVIVMATDVQVEEIRLKDAYNLEIDYNQTHNIELIGGSFSFKADTYPTIAYNHDVEIVKLSGSGEVNIDIKEGNHIRLTPIRGGEVTLSIRAKSNIAASKKVTIYISSKQLGRMRLLDQYGYVDTDIVYPIDSRTEFLVECYPLESISGQSIIYSTSDAAVATVDNNGVVTPKSVGICQLNISVTDNLGQNHALSLQLDTSSCMTALSLIPTDKELTTEEFSLRYLVNPNTIVTRINSLSYKLTLNGATKYINTILTDGDAWGFCNLRENLYIDNGGYYVYVANFVTEEHLADTEIYIENTDMAEITPDNRIVAYKTGDLTIFAKRGGVVKSQIVTIKKMPSVIGLNLTEEDNVRGISGTRVWSYKTVKNGSFSDSYSLGANHSATYPADSTLDLVWQSSDPDICTVDELGFLRFNSKARGKKVTISATQLYNGIPTDLVKTYTFNFTTEDNAVNVTTFDDLKYVSEYLRGTAIMQADIVAPTNSTPKWAQLRVFTKLFGNGFTLFNNITSHNTLEIYTYSGAENNIVIDNITIRNRGVEEQSGLYTGAAIFVYGNPSGIPTCKLTVSNCYLSYGAFGLDTRFECDNYIVGTIFSNIISVAIITIPTIADNGYLTIERCVLKDSTAFGFTSTTALDVVNINSLPAVTIKGFFDNYSWIKKEDFGKVVKVLDLDFIDQVLPGMADALSKEVTNLINEVFSSPGLKHLKLNYKGEDFFHLGALVLGMYQKPRISQFVDESKQYKAIPFAFDPQMTITLMGIPFTIKSIEALLDKTFGGSGKKITVLHTSFLISYNFFNNKPQFYPDDKCPVNEELFLRLRNAAEESK